MHNSATTTTLLLLLLPHVRKLVLGMLMKDASLSSVLLLCSCAGPVTRSATRCHCTPTVCWLRHL
jgi:hypothetical protein